MTGCTSPCTEQWRLVDVEAPAERLAMLRIIAGVFTLGYLMIRLPVFVELTDRDRDEFDGVGVLALLSAPLPRIVFAAVIAATIVGGVSFVLGAWFRVGAPMFALGMLVLTTSRSSWGQLLHFENLMVLHLLVIAFSPASDVWSLDARRRSGWRATAWSTRYGWPIALAGLVTVMTYVISGIAKLRYGGATWILGDTLRNHIAYSAARLDLLGGTPAPFAAFAVRNDWILPLLAGISVLIELTAPVALLGGRIRTVWVMGAWMMHVGIVAAMSIGFPSPLFGVAFAPFFRLERLVELPVVRRVVAPDAVR